MRKVRTFAVLCSTLIGSAKSQDVPVVTVTVHKTCSTTTFFPTYGWVTSNGSTIPYSFSSSPVATSSRAATTTSGATEQSSRLPTSILGSSATQSSATASSASISSNTISPNPSPSLASTSSRLQQSSTGSQTPLIPYPSESTRASSTATSALSSTTSACVEPTQSPLICPASDGTLYTPYRGCVSSNAEFTVLCARELDGQEILRVEDCQSVEECIALCSENVNCDAVSYNVSSRSCVQMDDVYTGGLSLDPDLICAYRLVNYNPPQYPEATTTSWSSSSSVPAPPIYSTNRPSTTSSQALVVTTQTSTTSAPPTSTLRSSTTSVTSASSSVSSPAPVQSSTTSTASNWSSNSSAQPSSTSVFVTSSSSRIPSMTPSPSSPPAIVSTTSSAATSSSDLTSSESPPPIYTPPSSSAPSSISSTPSFMSTSRSSSDGVTTNSSVTPSSPAFSTSSGSSATNSALSITSSSIKIIPPYPSPSASSDVEVIPVTTDVSSSVSETSSTSTSVQDVSSTSTSIELPPVYTPPSSTTGLTSPTPVSSSSLSSTESSSSNEESNPPIYVPPTSTSISSSAIETRTTTTTTTTSTRFSSSSTQTALDAATTTTTTTSISSSASSSSSSSSVVITPPPIVIPTPSTTSSESSTEVTPSSPPPYLVEYRECTNGTTQTGLEPGARSYNINCPSDTIGSGGTAFLERDFVLGDYLQCADLCDDTPECSVWVFAQGADPAVDPGGACYLKKAPQRPAAGPPGPDMVAGILVGAPGEPPTTPPQVYSEPGPCPESNGEVSADLEGNLFTTYCDMDSVPASMNVTGAPSFGACIDYCRLQSPDCAAVGYVPGEVSEGTCYLKLQPETMYSQPGVRLAVRVSTRGSVSSSSTSASASVTPTPVVPGPACPAANGTTYTDSEDNVYTVYCGFDSSPVSFDILTVQSYQGCMDACRLPNIGGSCGAAAYLPGTEGTDGTCYLKPSPDSIYSFPGVWLGVRALP